MGVPFQPINFPEMNKNYGVGVPDSRNRPFDDWIDECFCVNNDFQYANRCSYHAFGVGDFL